MKTGSIIIIMGGSGTAAGAGGEAVETVGCVLILSRRTVNWEMDLRTSSNSPP